MSTGWELHVPADDSEGAYEVRLTEGGHVVRRRSYGSHEVARAVCVALNDERRVAETGESPEAYRARRRAEKGLV